MTFKLVISDPNTGLSVQKDAAEGAQKGLVGLKIGDSFNGELLDLHGYELVLTGGSDDCGFPMRRDVAGIGRKKIFAHQGIGIRRQRKGMLQRKTVCGNTVHAKIAQINVKVSKKGTEDIFAEAAKKKEGKATKPIEGEAKAEPPKKEAAVKETQKAETAKPKEDKKPKSEVKEAPKAAEKGPAPKPKDSK